VAEANGRKLGFAALGALPHWPARTQLGFAGVQESGAPLALWKRTPRQRQPRLRVHHTTLSLPLQAVATPDTHPERFTGLPPHVREAIMLRQERLRQWVGEGESTEASLWVCHLGSMPVVAQQHEVYSRTTALLREAAGGPLLTLGLTNGGFGYLVPRELYRENMYVVRQTPFASGALEELEQAASATLGRYREA
jgi:hypothetical protein